MRDAWAIGKCECGEWCGFRLNDTRVLRFDQGPITLGVCPTCARLHALHHSTSMLVEDRAPKNAATIPSSEKRPAEIERKIKGTYADQS